MPSRTSPSEEYDRKAARTKYQDRFQEFYLAYPRKIDSTQAFAAFLDAVEAGEDPQFIIERARSFAHNTDPQRLQYVPSPKTWLRDRRWEDNDLLQDQFVATREWFVKVYTEGDAAAVGKRYGFIFADPEIPAGVDVQKYHLDARKAWIGAVARHMLHGDPLPE